MTSLSKILDRSGVDHAQHDPPTLISALAATPAAPDFLFKTSLKREKRRTRKSCALPNFFEKLEDEIKQVEHFVPMPPCQAPEAESPAETPLLPD